MHINRLFDESAIISVIYFYEKTKINSSRWWFRFDVPENRSFCQRFISLTFLGCVYRLVPSDDDTLRQFRIPIYSSNRFYITIDLFSHHLNWECFVGSYGSLLYNIDACFALVFSVFFPAVSSQNLICIFSVCKKKQIHETNLSILSAMVRAIIRRTKIESELNKAQGASNLE